MSSTELAWFKSSYSSGGDGDCVEVALSWHKSSYSMNTHRECVEVATCPDRVHVRDSKDKEGPQLSFDPAAWASFVAYASKL